jgi:hypothetical protein
MGTYRAGGGGDKNRGKMVGGGGLGGTRIGEKVQRVIGETRKGEKGSG